MLLRTSAALGGRVALGRALPSHTAAPQARVVLSNRSSCLRRAKSDAAALEKNTELVLPDPIEFGPSGHGDMIIDDYRREGKRTPQQLLVEAAVAKNYSSLKMSQNKRRHSDLNRRLRLQKAAIAALPEHLQVRASAPGGAPAVRSHSMAAKADA